MSTTHNIPSITTGKLVTQLTELYATAYSSGTLEKLPSVALWGPMGVGKSSAVKEIAQDLSQKVGKKVTVTDIRLLNFSPVDLRGIPSADEQRKFAVWLKPKIFDLPADCINILFLDEISAAPQSLQAAAYQIALDKTIGEHRLPKDCIVICAGNRTTDRSVAFRMPKALANRLMHFEVVANFETWYLWAIEQGLDERVIGYLAFDNSKLNPEAGLEELAFPTPRSWEFVSRLLLTTKKMPEQIHTLLSSCVGVSIASEFEAWCRVYDRLPATTDILSGKCIVPVKGADVTYAVISSLLTYITQRSEHLSAREVENVCRYASQFPADFAALFFRSLLTMGGMNLKLLHSPSFSAWMKQNKHIL